MAENDGGAPALETVQAQLAAATAELANAKARIAELNNESKGHRLNGDNHRKAAEEAQAARDAAIADAAKKLSEAETAHAAKVKDAETKATEALTKAQQRAVNADLKIAAKEAGASDLADVLALLPRDKLKISDDGDVTNAAEIMAEFKKAKPHLFGATSTSSAAPSPKTEATAKTAAEMTEAEWRTARESIRRGQRV